MAKEVKDKKIKFYRLIAKKKDDYEVIIKQYIHDEKCGGLWAYVRELSDTERFHAKSVQDDSTIQFKIVYNVKITKDLFIEFRGNTYQIVSIDEYEFNKTDLVVKANETTPRPFDEVEYEQY